MLTDDVQQAMFQAMKARRRDEAAALRLMLSALKSAAIDNRGDPTGAARRRDHGIPQGDQAEGQGGGRLLLLSDEQAVAVLQREARKRREAEQAYRDAGRPDRADQEAFERSVIDRFLPSMLEPAELARLVDKAVAATGASGPKELGKVMGRLMPQVKGRADGKRVSAAVKEKLTP
jgi:uncharacterized protein